MFFSKVIAWLLAAIFFCFSLRLFPNCPNNLYSREPYSSPVVSREHARATRGELERGVSLWTWFCCWLFLSRRKQIERRMREIVTMQAISGSTYLCPIHSHSPACPQGIDRDSKELVHTDPHMYRHFCKGMRNNPGMKITLNVLFNLYLAVMAIVYL